MIAYGAECGRLETTQVLEQLGVRSREYFLYVSRLEPENKCPYCRAGLFEKIETNKLHLVVGDAP
jgi:hypothetical protein